MSETELTKVTEVIERIIGRQAVRLGWVIAGTLIAAVTAWANIKYDVEHLKKAEEKNSDAIVSHEGRISNHEWRLSNVEARKQ